MQKCKLCISPCASSLTILVMAICYSLWIKVHSVAGKLWSMSPSLTSASKRDWKSISGRWGKECSPLLLKHHLQHGLGEKNSRSKSFLLDFQLEFKEFSLRDHDSVELPLSSPQGLEISHQHDFPRHTYLWFDLLKGLQNFYLPNRLEFFPFSFFLTLLGFYLKMLYFPSYSGIEHHKYWEGIKCLGAVPGWNACVLFRCKSWALGHGSASIHKDT